MSGDTINGVDFTPKPSKRAAKKEVAVIPPDPATLAIEKFGLTIPEAWIAERKKYLELQIFGPGDKENFEKVYEARQEIKKKRIEIEKNKKAFNKWAKEVGSKADILVAELQPIEDHLQSEEDRVEKQIEEEKAEKRRLQMERVNKRVERLLKADCSFDSLNYMYGEHSISQVDISAFTDAQFEEFAEGAEKNKERVDREKAEWLANKKREDEAAALRQAELEKENARIREENEKLLKQQEAQKRELENQRIKLEGIRLKNREVQLKALGLKATGSAHGLLYAIEGVEIAVTEMRSLDDEEWDSLISDVTPIIAAQKETAAARLADEQKAAEELAKKQADEKLQKDKEEQDRLEALKPDKEKLLALYSGINGFTLPELKDERAQRIVIGVKDLLGKVAVYIDTKMKAL